MLFIGLMIILNGWYMILSILQKNQGLTIATSSFVIYNFIVVYVFYCGSGGKGAPFCVKN